MRATVLGHGGRSVKMRTASLGSFEVEWELGLERSFLPRLHRETVGPIAKGLKGRTYLKHSEC